MSTEEIKLRMNQRLDRIERQRDVVQGLRVSQNGMLLAEAERLLALLEEQQAEDELLVGGR
jgi:hypothetical protein